MKATARQYFWWPKLDEDIENYVRACDTCKMNAQNPSKAALIKFNIK